MGRQPNRDAKVDRPHLKTSFTHHQLDDLTTAERSNTQSLFIQIYSDYKLQMCVFKIQFN
jgi:hypothetical protein